MEKQYIIGLDEGTTSLRSVVFDVAENKIVHTFKQPVTANYPRDGWVEQDGEDIYAKSKEVLELAVDTISSDNVAIGITNQREAVLLWGLDGKPLSKIISWQCRRTADMCRELKSQGYESLIKQKTGLVVDAYFSATKLKWLLDNTPNAREMAECGELLAGTIDSYLIYRITNGKSHITDASNASRTMLCNILTAEWDDELLGIFDIPKNILPRITDSCGMLGVADISGKKINVCGVAGDQQSALFGQVCFNESECKCTYGTGAFLLANVGHNPCISDSPLLSTIAYKLGGEITYALEGSVFNAGSTIDWLREVGLLKDVRSSAGLAKLSDDSKLFFVPAFTGLGAPYWDMHARAGILGINFGTKSGDIVRAALEGVAYSCYEVFSLMESIYGGKMSVLNADGGMADNEYLMQFQCDIMNSGLRTSAEREATVMGAVYLAGLGAGMYSSLDDIASKHKVGKEYFTSKEYSGNIEGWKNAVQQIRNKK